jgi:hypothetical protein
MNATTPVVVALAVAAALFTVAANAQTGRPSADEIGPAAAPTAVVDTASDQAGSFAHLQMLNGEPRDEAIAQARSYDHPKPRYRFAFHGKPVKPAAPVAPATDVR